MSEEQREFRYKGAVINGEIEDSDGMVVPNILTSVDAFGLTFSKKAYTKVDPNLVAYSGRRLNRETGKLESFKVTVAEKLAGNREFEERVQNAA